MTFEYFQGPISDMAKLCKEEKTCSICARVGKCFKLESAIRSDEASEAGYGCMECLAKGKFEFWHDTEVGMLGENGLSYIYAHNQTPADDFPENTLVALRRTPQIVTYQQELWLSCCNDFMIFLGTWQPADFHKHAPDRDGRALFFSMTEDDENLWDGSLPKDKKLPHLWRIGYYAFKCKHCDKLRGNWDCD